MNMKQIILVIALFSATMGFAQTIDQQRMNRDIEVAENILSALIKQQNSADGFYMVGNHSGVEGTYLEGYGVVFSINQSSTHFYALAPRAAATRKADKDVQVYSYGYGQGKSQSDAARDSIAVEQNKILKEAMQLFLSDYAYLIGQLKPEEKIMLRNDRNGWDFGNIYNIAIAGVGMSLENSSPTLSAEAKVSDIQSYQSGKLNREQFLQRIAIVENSRQAEVEPDVKLLASVFERLYQDDLSENFRITGRSGYQRLAGLGLIYSFNFSQGGYFSWGSGAASTLFSVRGKNRAITITGSGDIVNGDVKTDEQKTGEKEGNSKAEIQKQYDDFLNTFKQNMIEYGRLAKSLPADELLIFRLNFQGLDCDDCAIAEHVELTVKGSVLKDFDAGKISVAQGVSQIKMTKK